MSPSKLKGGNQKEYIIQRLKRDAPDIAATGGRWEPGKVKEGRKE
jgi:hypothetical protein